MTPEIDLEVAAASDTGCVRAHNEDSTAADSKLGLYLVADGMGGYRAGEVASAYAVTCIVRTLRRVLCDMEAPTTDLGRALRDALRRANDLIYRAAESSDQYRGMGTTLVGLLFHDDGVSIAHVGDCRAYRLRDGKLSRLTTDHTVQQELIDHGFCTPEQAAEIVSRSVVTRALGIDAAVTVDVSEQAVHVDDLYLLCSDGLNDMIDDASIAATLSANGGLHETAQRLIDLANQRGGQDNISVVLIRSLLQLGLRDTNSD